jgi:hypothetical protein
VKTGCFFVLQPFWTIKLLRHKIFANKKLRAERGIL